MKKSFKYYVVIWAISVALFNVVAFFTPNGVGEMSKFDGSFWVGYIFIMLTFSGQLGVAWYSLIGDEKKIFYRIPLIFISYGTLVVMLIVGILCMVIPNFPIGLGFILCLLVLAFSIISMMQAQTSISIVEDIDTKIRNKTFFIKSLIVDINTLMARASSQEIMEEIKKVYDVVFYSDPMSNEALLGVEAQISLKINELSEGVEKSDIGIVKKVGKELQILLDERNKKCKLLKG